MRQPSQGNLKKLRIEPPTLQLVTSQKTLLFIDAYVTEGTHYFYHSCFLWYTSTSGFNRHEQNESFVVLFKWKFKKMDLILNLSLPGMWTLHMNPTEEVWREKE